LLYIYADLAGLLIYTFCSLYCAVSSRRATLWNLFYRKVKKKKHHTIILMMPDWNVHKIVQQCGAHSPPSNPNESYDFIIGGVCGWDCDILKFFLLLFTLLFPLFTFRNKFMLLFSQFNTSNWQNCDTLLIKIHTLYVKVIKLITFTFSCDRSGTIFFKNCCSILLIALRLNYMSTFFQSLSMKGKKTFFKLSIILSELLIIVWELL
jgi:hypothetical protein